MAYRCSCAHLASATDLPIAKILNAKEYIGCEDCDNLGPDLWLCLQKGCLKIGCSYNAKDHGTAHNQSNPNHYTQMNLSTQRIWCYGCNSEVFLSPTIREGGESESDADMEYEGDSLRIAFERNNTSTSLMADGSDSSECEEPLSTQSRRPSGLVGLQNIGNTCYMNAALQALSNTLPLTRFFLECGVAVQVISEGKKPGLSRTYQALVRDIWTKRSGGYVTPSGILYGIRNVHSMFRGYHQHDTQEFLRNFMDQLHEELKQPASPEPSPEADNFMLALDVPPTSYDSSEGEYETCDSGVSERSSLSDDGERSINNQSAISRRRASSPNRRTRSRHPPAEAPPRKQPRLRSVISDVFDGKLLSSVQCLTCDRVSSRVETFQDLSLPIPSREHLVVLHGRSPGMTNDSSTQTQEGWMAWLLSWLRAWLYGPTVTLHDCLAAFFSTDELKGDNMYSCERCNKLRNGIKFSKVLQLPEVLCIHLKRFRHELMFSSKISSAVSFPLKGLDMRPYLHTECTSQVTSYDLTSVICHHGTAGGGHYTCLALNDGQWYEFDDQCVTKVTPEVVQSCEAYVLFYTKSPDADQLLNRNRIQNLLRKPFTASERVHISKQWLLKLQTCAEPGPIDNSDFLCLHGNLNPERADLLNRLAVPIARKAYECLVRSYGGVSAPTTLVTCPTCLATQRRIVLEAETFLQLGRAQKPVLSHVIALSWFAQWQAFVQRRVPEPPGPIDNSRVLLLEDPNEYAEISEDVWNFFHNIYGGGPEIRVKPKLAEATQPVPEEVEEEGENVDVDEESTVPAFCIPALKNKSPGTTINASLYCRGEPMDTTTTTANTSTESVGGGGGGGGANSDVEKSFSSASNENEETEASSPMLQDQTKPSGGRKHRRRRRGDLN